jgi:hypothetical protein
MSHDRINDHLRRSGDGFTWMFDAQRQTWRLVPEEETGDEPAKPRRQRRPPLPSFDLGRRRVRKTEIAE